MLQVAPITPSIQPLLIHLPWLPPPPLHHHHRPLLLCPFLPPPYLSFPCNLLSTNVDGSLFLFNADYFVHLKTFPFIHHHAINDLTLHPSGKLMLSVGCDEFLAIVNLVCHQRSFDCCLGKEASLMRFGSAVGDRFFIAIEDKVTMHESEDS